jgi:uncharacterized protein with HEPN domain
MKDPRLVQDYLQDILDAMDKAEKFINGLDLHTFAKDECRMIKKKRYIMQTIKALEFKAKWFTHHG